MKIPIKLMPRFLWYLLRFRSKEKALKAIRNWLIESCERLRQETDYWEKKKAIGTAEIILIEAERKKLGQEIAAVKALKAFLEFVDTLDDDEKDDN